MSWGFCAKHKRQTRSERDQQGSSSYISYENLCNFSAKLAIKIIKYVAIWDHPMADVFGGTKQFVVSERERTLHVFFPYRSYSRTTISMGKPTILINLVGNIM